MAILNRTAVIGVRVTEPDLKLIETAADQKNQRKSTWAAEVLRKAAINELALASQGVAP